MNEGYKEGGARHMTVVPSRGRKVSGQKVEHRKVLPNISKISSSQGWSSTDCPERQQSLILWRPIQTGPWATKRKCLSFSRKDDFHKFQKSIRSSTILCIYEIVYDQLNLTTEIDLLFFYRQILNY